MKNAESLSETFEKISTILVRDAKKDKKISENFFERFEDLIQKTTDKWIAKAEQLAQKKEQELKSSLDTYEI